MADQWPLGARAGPRYLVEIPFRAARNGRLTQAPYDLPDGARIEQTVLEDVTPVDERRTVFEKVQRTLAASDRSPVDPAVLADPEWIRYRYCVTIGAINAEVAMALAEASASALLDAFAAHHMAFELGPPEEPLHQAVGPPN